MVTLKDEAAAIAADANGGVPLPAPTADTHVEVDLAELSRIAVAAAQAALAGRNVTGVGLATDRDGSARLMVLFGAFPDGTSFH